MDRSFVRSQLASHYVLLSCEGSFEAVVVKRLIEGKRLLTQSDYLVEDSRTAELYTRLRKPADIIARFLRYDYPSEAGDGKLVLARIVDKEAKTGKADRSYHGRVIPFDFVTRPEIEMLAVIKEDAESRWDAARRKDKQLNVSQFCKAELGLSKSFAQLEKYWADVDELVWCIGAYHKKHGKSGLLDISDLLA